jgi:pimeloyl-ACP methyl ester carboxylesterase
MREGGAVHKRPWARRIALVFVLLVLGVLGAFVYAWVMPDFTPASHPRPTTTYAEAVARISAHRKADSSDVAYHQIFLGQGSRTSTSVVLFHGFTNAPRQMEVLAQAYARKGYNVYVPRMPHHGLADRMTTDLANANRRELIAWTDDAIDIGAGLGDHVVVSGLSAGATLSAWAARNRTEVSEAVLVAPLIQPSLIPEWATKPIYQLTPALPPIWVWWNPVKKEEQKAPEMAYPRYPLRSLGDFLALADGISRGQAQRRGTMARVVVIINEADMAVRNDVAVDVLERHLRPLSRGWAVHAIPMSRAWKHDLIDPLGENVANSRDIYRELLPLYGLDSAAETVTETVSGAKR